MDRFQHCGAKTNMKIIFDTESVRFEKNLLYVNQTITVTEDIPSDDLSVRTRLLKRNDAVIKIFLF